MIRAFVKHGHLLGELNKINITLIYKKEYLKKLIIINLLVYVAYSLTEINIASTERLCSK